jgi:hypothetical protein
MGTPFNNHLSPSDDKDKHFKSQKQRFLEYLKVNVATVAMVGKAIKVPEKNLTRYKRKLEKIGRLHELEKKTCKVTGSPAAYLTCNPDLFPFNPQTKLFQAGGGQDGN